MSMPIGVCGDDSVSDDDEIGDEIVVDVYPPSVKNTHSSWESVKKENSVTETESDSYSEFKASVVK